MPEPIETINVKSIDVARCEIGMDQHRKWLGAFGILSSEKGIAYLIDAYIKATMLDKDTGLLLMGPTSSEICSMIVSAQKDGYPILHINRYCSHEDLNTAIAAVNIVCVPYLRHVGASSIVSRAAHCGRPVLVSDRGWLKTIVDTCGLGWTCTPERTLVFASQLRHALKESTGFKFGGRARSFIQFQSESNFKRAWRSRINGDGEFGEERLSWFRLNEWV